MRYLSNSDYLFKISQEDFFTLIEDLDNASSTLLDTEIKAQESISLFLRKRYDLQQLFNTYPDYKQGQPYQSGQTVWYYSDVEDLYSAKLYTAVSATTASPASSGEYWQMTDPRFPLIVEWMVTISLYKLHERLSPDSMPTHRKDAYNDVMNVLKSIQQEKLSPDFPELENRSFGIYVNGKPDTGISYQY